jgi:hypothetical protein
LTPATAWPLEPGKDRTTVRLLEFVEVRAEVRRDGRPAPGSADSSGEPDASPDTTLLTATTEPRWSLWGDAEA